MIGLVPESMTLIEPKSSHVAAWEVELCQSWKNAAAVLDGLDDGTHLMGGKLEDSLGALIYISQSALEALLDGNDTHDLMCLQWKRLWLRAESISRESITRNGGVIVGNVDGYAPDTLQTNVDPSLYDENGVLYGGYEDEGTWREILSNTSVEGSSDVPLFMVCLPELPAKAQTEVELICASKRAATCLDVCTGPFVTERVQQESDFPSLSDLDVPWNTGYDGTASRTTTSQEDSNIMLSSVSRLMGCGCASMSTVMASWKDSSSCACADDTMNLDTEQVISQMIDLAISNAKRNGDEHTLFSVKDVLHVRLYYTAASISRLEVEFFDDGSNLRSQLHSVLRLKSTMHYCEKNGFSENTKRSNLINIAATVVPVLGMHLASGGDNTLTQEENQGEPLMAMQVFMCDMLRTEAELWIRYNR
jgi:hypothetical protein